jgi:hypothetical protein
MVPAEQLVMMQSCVGQSSSQPWGPGQLAWQPPCGQLTAQPFWTEHTISELAPTTAMHSAGPAQVK